MGGLWLDGFWSTTQAKKICYPTLPYFVGDQSIMTQWIVCQEKNIILEIFFWNSLQRHRQEFRHKQRSLEEVRGQLKSIECFIRIDWRAAKNSWHGNAFRLGFRSRRRQCARFFDCPTRPANGELRINIPFEFGTDLHGAITMHQATQCADL